MIDASRSPTPLWKRLFRLAVLLALIVVVALLIWTKELHHPLGRSPVRHPAAVMTLRRPA